MPISGFNFSEVPSSVQSLQMSSSPILLSSQSSQILNGLDVKMASVPESLNTSDIPQSIKDKFGKMQNENAQLKILLEKLDNHTQKQEEEIEALKEKEKKFNDLSFENNELRTKLKSFALAGGKSLDDIDDLRKVNSELESSNNTLMERLVALEEELKDMKLEKDSLVSTLQLMQDELMASEQVRQRHNTGSFTDG